MLVFSHPLMKSPYLSRISTAARLTVSRLLHTVKATMLGDELPLKIKFVALFMTRELVYL